MTIEQFDFNDIVDYTNDDDATPYVQPEENSDYTQYNRRSNNQSDMVDEEQEFNFDDEEEFDNSEDDSMEEEDESQFGSTLEEVASNFDTLPEDVEFVIHGEKVSKKDIAEVVHKSKELKEAYSNFNDYVAGLSEVEMRVQTYLQASMTETETRLRQIESMLDNPEKLTSGELQKAYIAQRDLRKRQAQLEENASNVRRAEEERRQQVDIVKIRQTNAALNGTVPGYKGMNTLKEIATWAQQQGMDEQSLRSSMSPEFIKMLMDAKMYREKVGGKSKVREAATKRLNTGASPKSISSKPKAKAQGGAISKHQKSRAYEAAMKAGDMSAAFAYLEN